MYGYLRIHIYMAWHSEARREVANGGCIASGVTTAYGSCDGYMRKKPAPHVQAQPQWEAAQ